MPISDLMLAAAALLVLSVVPMASQAAVLVRSASELSKDASVVTLMQPYRAIAAAHVIYDQCGTELGVTQAQRSYLAALFDQTSKDYMRAYADAYKKRVGTPPDQRMSLQYRQLIQLEQQQAVNQIATYIAQKTCRDERVKNITDYIEKRYQADQTAAKDH